MSSRWEDISYEEKICSIKCVLNEMIEIEDFFYYFTAKQECEETKIRWGTDAVEIKIDEFIPEEDIFYLTVLVLPVKSKGKRFPTRYSHYFYKIEEDNVSRELFFNLTDLPIRESNTEDLLDEIITALFFIGKKEVHKRKK